MELELDIETGLPSTKADASALTLAVLNLIDNAVKHASEGKRVIVRVTEHRGGINVEVRDFGPGIPSHEQSRIFERFYRVRSASKSPSRGSGIGLALVRNIATAHKGEVEAISRETGTSFRLWIPALGD